GLNNLTQIRFLGFDTDLAAGDRTKVQEVIDDVRQRSRVAGNRMSAAAGLGLCQVAVLEQPRPPENRIQRGAQLMRERFEEFILEPTRAFGFGASRSLALQRSAELVDGLVHGGAELWRLEAAIASLP